MMFVGIRQTRTPRDAIAYFRSARDHAGRERDHEPRLARGFPEHFVRLGDRLSEYTKFCCTGVWAFGIQPRDDQLARMLKVFPRAVLPGLAPERVAAVYYYHNDHGHPHVHFAVMAVDLETGKRFTPYVHRRDRKRFRFLAQLLNDTEGYPDPNNPANRRLVMPPPVKSDEEYLAVHREISSDIEAIVRNCEAITPDGLCEALEEFGWQARRAHLALKVARAEGHPEVTIYGAVTRQKVFYAADYHYPIAQERWRDERKRRLAESAKVYLALHRGRALANQERYDGTFDHSDFELALEALAQGAPCAPEFFGKPQRPVIRPVSVLGPARSDHATSTAELVVPEVSLPRSTGPAAPPEPAFPESEQTPEPMVGEDTPEFSP